MWWIVGIMIWLVGMPIWMLVVRFLKKADDFDKLYIIGLSIFWPILTVAFICALPIMLMYKLMIALWDNI